MELSMELHLDISYFSSNFGNKAQLPTEWSLETSVPCSWGICREGTAKGAEAEPSGGRAVGRRMVWLWGVGGWGNI